MACQIVWAFRSPQYVQICWKHTTHETLSSSHGSGMDHRGVMMEALVIIVLHCSLCTASCTSVEMPQPVFNVHSHVYLQKRINTQSLMSTPMCIYKRGSQKIRNLRQYGHFFILGILNIYFQHPHFYINLLWRPCDLHQAGNIHFFSMTIYLVANLGWTGFSSQGQLFIFHFFPIANWTHGHMVSSWTRQYGKPQKYVKQGHGLTFIFIFYVPEEGSHNIRETSSCHWNY